MHLERMCVRNEQLPNNVHARTSPTQDFSKLSSTTEGSYDFAKRCILTHNGQNPITSQVIVTLLNTRIRQTFEKQKQITAREEREVRNCPQQLRSRPPMIQSLHSKGYFPQTRRIVSGAMLNMLMTKYEQNIHAHSPALIDCMKHVTKRTQKPGGS